MLTLKPNCELCDKDLPVTSKDAYICSYECTFCRDCVDSELQNVCPNCGGEFTRRPIRPSVARRNGISLEFQASSTERVLSKYSLEQIREFSKHCKDIAPQNR